MSVNESKLLLFKGYLWLFWGMFDFVLRTVWGLFRGQFLGLYWGLFEVVLRAICGHYDTVLWFVLSMFRVYLKNREAAVGLREEDEI